MAAVCLSFWDLHALVGPMAQTPMFRGSRLVVVESRLLQLLCFFHTSEQIRKITWFTKILRLRAPVASVPGKAEYPKKTKKKKKNERGKHDQKASNDIADLAIKEVNFMNIMFFKIENRN